MLLCLFHALASLNRVLNSVMLLYSFSLFMSCVGRCLTRASLSNILVIYHISVVKLEDRSRLDKGKVDCTFQLDKFCCLSYFEGEMRRLGVERQVPRKEN